MTRRRKLAIKILDTVVRRSLPSYRDWAEASRRELEFIEGDWAALGWALGSFRMAASCQNAPLTSMSEVPRAARNFLREIRVSAVMTIMSLLVMSFWFSGVFLHTIPGRQTRLGSGLGWALVLGMLVYIVCEAIAFRGWRLPREGGLPEVAVAYRLALMHQRDLLSGVWLWSRLTLIMAWPLLAAYNVWLLKPSLGREIILRGNLAACGIMVLTLILARPVNRRIVARYQRTIDQLDALQGEAR
jgi:uncharacterized membrane protein (DUF485 family)